MNVNKQIYNPYYHKKYLIKLAQDVANLRDLPCWKEKRKILQRGIYILIILVIILKLLMN